jgi:ATP-dependent helicase Lhr and Lhr-like helicase
VPKKQPPKLDVVDSLAPFHAATRTWFEAVFPAATKPQQLGWPAIARGESTLILAPTGTGKTLAAFLWCIDRLMFHVPADAPPRCRILYISPIKALAVDVERNLRSPLIGISQSAQKMGVSHHEPQIFIRTGDTSAGERARFGRRPPDILITTPESLYLLLTSNAREALLGVETVIVDEIHALVPTKRGSHLALSLERLEQLCGRRLQRIGLSATQRPLEEVARFLGGTESADSPSAMVETQHAASLPDTVDDATREFESSGAVKFRNVTILNAGERKKLELKIHVPLEDMAKLDEVELIPSGPASQGPVRKSIWTAIHPQLLELVRAHRSILIFVNSRRLAERLSGALNDLAGEVLVRAHHGSVAASQRKEIEDRLKMGTLRGLVATSSLELGIDMGAVDLVIQIEAPPSVASGMQRIGRASHHVGAVSKGLIFPKYRADLLACAAAARAMYEGKVEAARYPRNALDVLAQQIVAMIAMDDWNADDLFSAVRRAAPYASLGRGMFDSVLEMLAGRYPSDEFAELRPRITWDRISNSITAREGSRRIAVVNGGTIPDRGLYGVFLAGAEKGGRVGELDEEMVFESRQGDTFTLGASTWRIEEITHDRVLVSPAPGEPGKMPFWHGDTASRPAEFGDNIGRMGRELLQMPQTVAYEMLSTQHSLDQNAAENLLRYLRDQAEATGRIPSDQDVIIERCRDELGDWRICVLSPFGTSVHAPWCMAAMAKVRNELGLEAEAMWSDDGFVLRLPETDLAIDSSYLLPDPAEFQQLVLRQLGSTSLFAAKFREVSARALLLPRRRPGMRAPLWQQRKRAADLLAVASRFPSFPMLLETYRECLRDVFDLPAATRILRRIRSGEIRVSTVDSAKPSPFASALLFSYIANYIYEGDAPLAERRAQALAIDQSQLQELLGDSDLRELLDQSVIDEVEAQLQLLESDYQARHADAVHDMLLRLGDLSSEEISRRSASETATWINELEHARRAILISLGGSRRYIAVEDAARYRDAFGIPLPPGLAEVWLQQATEPLLELFRRYARTHVPFTTADICERFGTTRQQTEPVLKELESRGRLLEGEFRPTGTHREWCDVEVLRTIRRKTLARLRREVEPVEQRALGRLLVRWQGAAQPRRGLNALLDAVEILQGVPLPISELEREVLPVRVMDYKPGDLDTLLAAGEVAWVGVERLGERDGRIALYLTENLPRLLPPAETREPHQLTEKAKQIVELMRREGALFFPALQSAITGFPGETLEALWELVWAGKVTNDTFHPVRNLRRGSDDKERRGRASAKDGIAPGSPEFLKQFRSRTASGSAGQGRWSLLESRLTGAPTPTEWLANFAQQLLVRYGVVSRETANVEHPPGGYSAIYQVLKKMEEGGWVRRGMFIAGMGAAQFALPSAIDLLRSFRLDPDKAEAVHLAASDPANAYGGLLPWPRESDRDDATSSHGMSRVSGASVVLVNGSLAAFLRRRNPGIRVFLPEDEPARSNIAGALAKKLADVAIRRQAWRSGLLIGEINGLPTREHFLARFLEESGFVNTALGFQMRRVAAVPIAADTEMEDEDTEAGESAESA